MRNLKRALSLALASVMLLGMMVVGTSAASYPDVDEKDNVEAIEVLNAVNVMIGRQGNFEPDEAVNRHEMAVIMAKLVLGVDTADNYVGSHPFTDVVPWADKYVAACYEHDLISGTSTTTYGGSQPLTAVQAALMMLRALGYKDLNKGATDWRAPVTAMANQIRLFDGVASNPGERLNRNQVAQLALNTLKSPMVNLKDNTISWNDGDGQIVIGGSREYIVLSSREPYAYAINSVESSGDSASGINGATVELGEHLYNGKLRLDDDTDVFLRPARTWQYDGKKIGTYVKEELLRATYSTEVTGKTLYDLLSKNTISKYDFTIAIDGVDTDEVNTMTGYFTKGNLVSTNTRGVGATGKGVTTEVYVDSVKGEVTIAVINTYLAKAAEKYNEKRDEVKFNVWGLEQKSGPRFLNKNTAKNPANTFPLVVSGEDFDVKNVAKSDIVLVRVADNAIQEIIQPEVIDKTVLSSFSKGSWVNNGTKYDYANTARYDDKVLDQYSKPNMKELTYNLYLDEYGYMIGIERNEDPDQYVFLAGIDAGDSNLKATTADANVIHVDGTMKTVKVDMNKSTLPSYMSTGVNNSQLNTWCKYSVSTDGVYKLTEIDHNPAKGADTLGQFAQDVAVYPDTGKTNKTITEKRTSLVASVDGAGKVTSWVYGNDDTKYINVELKGVVVKDNVNGVWPVAGASGIDYRRIIDDVDTVITGIKDVDLEMTDLPTTQKNDKGVSEYINPDAEIYTLYKEGIVIAAVTIGEDNGSAATWAYITSKEPRQEDYYHETESSKTSKPGEWTWYREAVVDGKIVDLIEVGDSLSWIGNESGEGNMQQGEWWEIKVDADGNVRKSTLLSKVLGDRFQTESKDVEETVNTESGDVVLQMDFVRADYKANKDTLTFKNGNLYTNSDLTKGFSVSRNVKVVLGQAQLKSGYDNGDGEKDWGDHGYKAYVDQWKYKDDIFEGYDGLKAVLDRLDANFVGDLNVIFHNGAASVIVINDIWGEYIDEGEYIGNKDNAKGDADLIWISDNDWELVVEADANVSSISRIADYMAKAGCTEIVHTRYGWSFTFEGVRHEDQTVKVVKKAGDYELTVDDATNGTVSSKQTGNNVTLTIKADTGYELKTLTVGGKDVTASVKDNGAYTYTYSFTMTENTTVTATFKLIGGESYAVDIKGTAVKDNHYETDLPADHEVAKGESFTITAKKTLGIVVYDETGRHVVRKSDGPYTVTPTGDITVFINRITVGPVGDTGMGEVEDKTPDTPSVSSMARFARAASLRADEYMKMIVTDVDGEDHEYIVKVVTGTDGMRTFYFPTAESANEAIAILNAIDVAGGEFDPDFDDPTPEEIEENWGDDNESGTVQARITTAANFSDNTIGITLYAYGETEVTAELAAGAINAVEGLSEANIKLDGNGALEGKVTVDVPNSSATRVMTITFASAQELFKVTYPGVGGTKAVYVEAGGKIEDIADGVLFLIDKTLDYVGTAANANAVDVTAKAGDVKSNVTLTGLNADIEYVEAYKIDDTDKPADANGSLQATVGASPATIVTVGAIDGTTGAPAALGTSGYLRKGATLYIALDANQATDANEGKGITLTAGAADTKTDLTIKDGKVTPPTVTVNEADVSGKVHLKVTAPAAAPAPKVDLNVILNDGEPKVIPADDAYITINSIDSNLAGAKVYYLDPKTGELKDTTETVSKFNAFAWDKSAAGAAIGENNTVKLYTVYTVAVSTGDVYSVFDVDPATEGAVKMAKEIAVKTIENKTLWVQAGSDALNAALTNAKGIKMACVKAPDQTDTTTGAVYKITVSSDIAATGTFTSAVKVAADDITLETIAVAGTASGAAVIDPTTYDTTKMKVSFNPVSADDENKTSKDVSKVTVAWGTEGDAGKVVFANEQEIAKEAGKNIGTITVEVTGPNNEVWATVINVKFAA